MLRSWSCPGSTVPHAATSSATGSPHATSFMPAPLLHSPDQAYPRSQMLRKLACRVQNQGFTGAVAPGVSGGVRPHRRTGGRMSRPIAAGILLVASAACTSLTASADCASSTCPDGQTCDPQTRLCVLDLSPEITVLSPKPGAAVKDPALEVRGTVATWSDSTLVGMSYQLVDAGSAGGVPVDGGLFSLTIPLPALDGEDVQLVLLARDSQDRERRVSVPFRVDDVAPRPRFAPGDGERGADVQLTVDFGEAVSGSGAPAALVPGGATGAYDSAHQRYVFSGLSHDTGYLV